ncbi:MAG: hypothetical protein GX607_02365 [Myxococcales bacterium]|nr:hypothetical protein [Myxococcales bacterium]
MLLLPQVAAASPYSGSSTAGGSVGGYPTPKKTSGISLVLTAGPAFGTAPSHEWATTCPTLSTAEHEWQPGCSASRPMGFTVDVRLEVLWGVLGFDLFALGAGDWTEADVSGQPPVPLPDYASQMHIGRLGAGLGGGLRFKTKPKAVRFSAGAGGGAMLRHVYTNVSSVDGDAVRYAAPIVRADVGAVAGTFTLGIMGWVELVDRVTVTPDLSSVGQEAAAFAGALGDVALFDGPEFFVGPFIGLHLGG